MQAPLSNPLIQRFHTASGNLLQALEQPQFYAQLLIAGISVAIALLAALLIRRIIKRNAGKLFSALPSALKFNLTPASFSKPLKLLAPLLAVLILNFAASISSALTGTDTWILHAITLADAWLLVRLVSLLVRTRPVAIFINSIIIYLAFMHTAGLGHYMHDYLASLDVDIGAYHLSMLGIVHGIVIFVIVFWLAGTITQGTENYMRRSSRISYNARELILQFFRVIVYAIAFLTTLNAMGVDLTALAVFGGALGVGVGLGLQKLTANFVSGVTLLLEKSVKIGDLIEVAGNTGWVRQLHTRYALIETFDGREILVPNEELTSSRVTNWTYSNANARIEIIVPVSYNADPHQARDLMLQAARSNPRCLRTPEPNCVLREFGDNGMKFQLTFWVQDVKEGRAGPQSEVMLAILDKFHEAGIRIPVTTVNP